MVIAKGMTYRITFMEKGDVLCLSVRGTKELICPSDGLLRERLPKFPGQLVIEPTVSVEENEMYVETSMNMKKENCTYVKLMNLIWEMKLQIYSFFAELQAVTY